MKLSAQLFGRTIDAVVIFAAAAIIAVVFARTGSSSNVRLSKDDWGTIIDNRKVIGSPSAKVTLVEFVDYQCPICTRMEPVISALHKANPGEIRRVIRHFPIVSIHREAERGAVAVECAADQGRFPEMHAALLNNQEAVGMANWEQLAKIAQVELGSFRDCLQDSVSLDKVRSDLRLGEALGVSGTPTFLLNGEWLLGVTAPELRERLQRKLRSCSGYSRGRIRTNRAEKQCVALESSRRCWRLALS